jgi:hypothetical protein
LTTQGNTTAQSSTGRLEINNPVKVTKAWPDAANIEQLQAKRSWMDDTPEKHAYMCFPLNLTNRLGWGISFPEDIVVIWDGVTDTTPDHIKILKGEKYVSTGRGNATLSFNTGLILSTDPETSIMAMPVPNQFVRGAQCYTTVISTSFYIHTFPIAWRITEPNTEICIPANTPVASVLPISLTRLERDYYLEISGEPPTQAYWDEVKKYGDVAESGNDLGDWSKMYRDAVNYKGEKVGAHETKSIKLKTVTCPFTGQSYEVEDDSVDHSE